jgi:hypothetical protein
MSCQKQDRDCAENQIFLMKTDFEEGLRTNTGAEHKENIGDEWRGSKKRTGEE